MADPSYGFKNRQDAKDCIARNQRERIEKTPGIVPSRLYDYFVMREYWIVPKGTIPAATDWKTPGEGTAYLIRLDKDASPPVLKRWQFAGSDSEVTVWNFLPHRLVEVTAGGEKLKPLYRASQDVFGDLSILKEGRTFYGKANGTITKDTDTGTVDVWAGDPLVDTGDDITANFKFLHGDEDISDGKEVAFTWISELEAWGINGAECE